MKNDGGYVVNMHLRDWFAGMAMAELMRLECSSGPHNMPTPTSLAVVAEYAYLLADTMIAEREKGA